MTDLRTASVHLFIFAAEAEEYLDELRTQLAALDEGIDAAAESRLLRPAHALKGTARMLGFEAIANLCHHFEEAAASSRSSIRDGSLETLRESVDVLERMVSSALHGGPVPADEEMVQRLRQIPRTSKDQSSTVRARLGAIAMSPLPASSRISRFSSPSAHPRTGPLSARLRRSAEPKDDVSNYLAFESPFCSAFPDSLSVPVPELDALMTLLKRLRQSQKTATLDASALSELRSRIQPSQSAVEQSLSAGLGLNLSEVLALVDRCLQRTATTQHAMQRLERRMRRLRFCRVDVGFGHLGSTTRTLAQKEDKRARCILHGGHLEVERELVYGLSDPITHLIGNAVHHGLEDPRLRKQHGKPAVGTIRLSWQNMRHGWRIEIADDGAGIDAQCVREKARQHGLFPDDALENMDDQQIVQLIFADGITTSSTLSIAGGRGIGLAIVRAAIEKLNGRVQVATRMGLGTTFTIDIPRSRLVRRGTPSNR